MHTMPMGQHVKKELTDAIKCEQNTLSHYQSAIEKRSVFGRQEKIHSENIHLLIIDWNMHFRANAL